MKIRYILFFAVFLLAVVQGAFYYSRLPEPVATHFGAAGQVDNWMSKSTFTGFMLGLLVFMGLVFTVLPVFLTRLPVSMINLPNKEYWLAPARRAQTNSTLRGLMLEMGIGTIVLIITMNQLAIRANFQSPPRLAMGPFWIFLVAYLVFTGLWIFRLYRRFPKVT